MSYVPLSNCRSSELGWSKPSCASFLFCVTEDEGMDAMDAKISGLVMDTIVGCH